MLIKILKSASIIFAAAAVLVLTSAVFSKQDDSDLKKILSAAGIAEQLKASYSGRNGGSEDKDTPLIRQARDFALRINPPPPPQPAAPVDFNPAQYAPIRPQVSVSAKFKLIGTSYKFDDEKNSWALVDEVGKGLYWVKLGDSVGHLKVEKIGDGVILIKDGSNTYELAAERSPKSNFVVSYTGEDAQKSDVWKGSQKAITEIMAEIPTADSPQETPQPQPTKEDIQENIRWLKQLRENPQALGMTEEEAKELEDMGALLQTLEGEAAALEENQQRQTINTTGNTTDANLPQQQQPKNFAEQQINQPNFPNISNSPGSPNSQDLPPQPRRLIPPSISERLRQSSPR